MQDAFDDDTIAMLDQKTGTKPATATSTAPALKPAATTAPATAPGVRLVDPLDLYLEQEAGGDLFFDGDFLNFNGQSGFWSLGQNKDPIGATVPFICNVRGIAIGNVKMIDGKIVDREIGLISDGYQRKPPELLPDRDKRYWPYNKLTNEREDPWKPTSYLPMRNMENDAAVVFGPFSKTARGEIRALVKVCRRTDRGGKDPVVLLEERSFKNQKGGTTYAPVLKLVGWDFWTPGEPAPEPALVTVPTATQVKPAAAKALPKRGDGSDMDDEIPF